MGATSLSACPFAEPHLTARDRQIRHCTMIHTTTAATISVAMTQFMTIVAHIVANTWRTDEQRRRMQRPLTPGASARAWPRNRFFRRDFGGAPSRGAASVIS